MKSIGKQLVSIKSYSDGVLLKSSTSNRVVYEDKNGDFYTNHLNGKKKIKKDATGFVMEYHSRTIVSNDIQDVFC
jgi:hypothetical protein